MDQNYNNSQNDFLWTLLANPAEDARAYNYNLQRLVNDFPQSGILQALLAHSSEQKNLKQASVYFNSRSLYKLINAPASLIGVADEKIIIQNNINSGSWAGYKHVEPEPQPEPQSEITENYFSVHAPEETVHEAAAPAEEHQPQAEHEQTYDAVYEHYTPSPVAVPDHQVVEEAEHIQNEYQQHIEPVYEHQPESEAHLAEPVAGEATHQETEAIAQPQHEEPVIAAHDVHETVTETTEQYQPEETQPSRASIFSEIKGLMSDTPYSAPIINYAHGLGRKMTGESEPVNEHIEAEQTAAEPVAETATTSAEPETYTPPTDYHYEEPAAQEATPSPAQEQYFAPAEHTHHEQAETNEHQQTQEYHEQPQHQYFQPEAHEQHPVEQQYAQPEHPAQNNNAVETPHYDQAAQAPEVHHQPETNAVQQTNNIEDETYDEIVGIENIGIEPDIIGNIAATDYFSFDRRFGAHKEPEPVNEVRTEADDQDDQADVSKYHDEKMPYSFLWWLDKTRKEHASVYQPYVAPPTPEPASAIRKGAADELQQQYYENIFHITSFEEFEKSAPLPPPYAWPVDHKRKEQSIIDRFIQEEPQIRPQSSDKLDNENKAKKSSEDRDELVSETLAAIYTDQMLYHKAIASYKKLILKFPEKSRYFVDKIEQLEKKTN